jgi:RND family efflux transporter MFP subunit
MADQLSSDLASLRIVRDVPPEGQGKGRGWVIVLSLAVAGGAIAAAYTFGMPYLEARVFRSEVATTEIALVSPAQSSVQVTSAGYVAARVTSKVGAKITGRVAKVLVHEGDRTKAGQTLFELEDADLKAAVAAARARVMAAKARAEAARANLYETQIQADRQRALQKAGASPAAMTQDLDARAKSLAEAVKVAEAEVQSQEAEVSTLSINLQYTTIVAPISGTAISKPVDVGETVGPLSPALVELADFSTLLVETDVPEARLHFVKVAGPAEIVLDAYPSRRYRGAVREIVPRVNRAKATVMVKVEFVDEADGVLSDMAARVSFLEKPLDATSMKEPPKLIVPGAAVVERLGSKVVFALDGDQVRMTPVKLGPPFGSGFELREGPKEGTRVVRDPPATLSDLDRVKEKTGHE